MIRPMRWRPLRAILLLLLAALLVPDSGVHPASLALVKVSSAEHVDFEEGTVWILALGSDARPGEPVTDGLTDAIQLVGMNARTGSVVGIGIPRDSWVELPGYGRKDRINTALDLGDEELSARVVADLTGIQPDYVLVVGFDGLRGMVEAIGGVTVRSPLAFTDEEHDITVRRGPNRFGPEDALNYTRSRKEFVAGDFVRSANQQRLMLGVLDELRAHRGEEGFMERGALAAMAGLRTDLSPTQIYRLAHAVSQFEPRKVGTCVIPGRPGEVNGASVVFADGPSARRIGDDVREDARLDGSCGS